MTTQRLAVSALGIGGATLGIPIGLAQLDFAGILNFVNIDSGDSPTALLVIAGISGFGTLALAAVGLVGGALAFTDLVWARRLLLVAALGGIVSATIFWLAPGVALGAAAMLAQERGRAAGGRVAEVS